MGPNYWIVTAQSDHHGAIPVTLFVMDCQWSPEKMLPNAIMAAAAPELYEALKDMVDVLEAEGIRSDAVNRAHAAILKAEGRFNTVPISL